MVQHIQNGGMTGSSPLDLAFVGTGVRTHGHPNAMIEHVPNDGHAAAELFELVKEQMHNRLDLFIGVQGHFP